MQPCFRRFIHSALLCLLNDLSLSLYLLSSLLMYLCTPVLRWCYFMSFICVHFVLKKLQGAVAQYADNQTRNTGEHPLLLSIKCTGVFYVRYTTHGTNGFTSHLTDEAPWLRVLLEDTEDTTVNRSHTLTRFRNTCINNIRNFQIIPPFIQDLRQCLVIPPYTSSVITGILPISRIIALLSNEE